ncbi:MAG: nitroreductase family protein [Lactobacillales bacterium]|jgi:nitroreductase|nr:nitroreductase family protein [Lactobacillales bacterium]
MDAIQALLSRRSIRKYTDKQIEKQDLLSIIQAGIHAPNGLNRQAVHITALHSAQKIAALEQHILHIAQNLPDEEETAALKQGILENHFHLCYGAPTFIIVSASSQSIAPEMDCAVCMENMLIAATALGISSCFINTLFRLVPTPTIQSIMEHFGVPKGNVIHCAAGFGYGAEQPAPHSKRQGAFTIVE